MTSAKRRVTIKDVAAEAGVSYQTVSRVINDNAHVSDLTRHRVKQVIENLNYRPSLAARSLPRRRSYVIGFIIPYETDYLITDPNLLAQISGIDEVAYRYGYSLLLATTGSAGSGIEAYRRFVQNQAADGALVIDTASTPAGRKLLEQQNYPYVYFGYNPDNPNAYYVHCDDQAGARAITHHLLEKGHRRIGIINGPATGAVASMQERLKGHCDVLEEAGIEFDPSQIVYGDYTSLSGQRATEKLFSQPQPPTAIFAFNDRMAMGAVQALKNAGLSVPADVAVAGFDDIPAAAHFDPPLTTVRQPSKQIGQKAAELLFRLIAEEPVEKREYILPAELVIRESA